MIRQDPILIAAPPRSGTTMMAGLLYYHGVWVGKSRTTMYPGTNSDFGSENTDIKKIFKHHANSRGCKHWETPFPKFGGDLPFKKQIESFVPEDTPWLVKTSWCLMFWEFWVKAYPNAKWVFPTRDTLKIVDSMNRHPGMKNHPDGEKRQYIANLLRSASNVIDKKARYTFVDVEGLADKDPAVIGDFFRFLEIEPDYKVIDEWIKPEMLKR